MHLKSTAIYLLYTQVYWITC